MEKTIDAVLRHVEFQSKEWLQFVDDAPQWLGRALKLRAGSKLVLPNTVVRVQRWVEISQTTTRVNGKRPIVSKLRDDPVGEATELVIADGSTAHILQVDSKKKTCLKLFISDVLNVNHKQYVQLGVTAGGLPRIRRYHFGHSTL